MVRCRSRALGGGREREGLDTRSPLEERLETGRRGTAWSWAAFGGIVPQEGVDLQPVGRGLGPTGPPAIRFDIPDRPDEILEGHRIDRDDSVHGADSERGDRLPSASRAVSASRAETSSRRWPSVRSSSARARASRRRRPRRRPPRGCPRRVGRAERRDAEEVSALPPEHRRGELHRIPEAGGEIGHDGTSRPRCRGSRWRPAEEPVASGSLKRVAASRSCSPPSSSRGALPRRRRCPGSDGGRGRAPDIGPSEVARDLHHRGRPRRPWPEKPRRRPPPRRCCYPRGKESRQAERRMPGRADRIVGRLSGRGEMGRRRSGSPVTIDSIATASSDRAGVSPRTGSCSPRCRPG